MSIPKTATQGGNVFLHLRPASGKGKWIYVSGMLLHANDAVVAIMREVGGASPWDAPRHEVTEVIPRSRIMRGSDIIPNTEKTA